MKSRRALVLKGFLNRKEPDKREALERLLPSKEQKILADLPIYQMEQPSEEEDFLERIHWSWFLPTLKSHSDQEQTLFLASLDPSIASSICEELKIPLPRTIGVSPMGKQFMRGILFHSLVGATNQLLPVECLPPTPLNSLLYLSKKELTQLMDDLSMYDLAVELRQIVETKILKKIYSFLSEEQKKSLKIAMAQRESYSIPRIGLDKWDGTEESFRHLLHRRGLARLGAALSGQDPDLIWYICHQLDIGRGNALFKLCKKETAPGLSAAVLEQIEEWLANLKE